MSRNRDAMEHEKAVQAFISKYVSRRSPQKGQGLANQEAVFFNRPEPSLVKRLDISETNEEIEIGGDDVLEEPK
jgi:hypothetical protein